MYSMISTKYVSNFDCITGMALICLAQALNFLSRDANVYVSVYLLAAYFIFFSLGMGVSIAYFKNTSN